MCIKLIQFCIIYMFEQHNEVVLTWCPAHSGIFGNCRADILAQHSLYIGFEGPEPFIPIPKYYITRTISLWIENNIKEEWRFSTTCETTKLFLNEPNSEFTIELLKLSKPQLRIVTGLLTGHCCVNSYLRRIGQRDDSDCSFCGSEEETSMHFLCRCPHFNAIRRQIFNCDAFPTWNLTKFKPLDIFEFVKRSKRQLM